MPFPLLLALGGQALGTGLSALAARSAKKQNKAAMKAAEAKLAGYNPPKLGERTERAYMESKLAENALNPYQAQEAQDLLRSQAEANYNISDYAPTGFAALGAQAANQGQTQKAIGGLGAKYAPMAMQQKQITSQLAGDVDRYNALNQQAAYDKLQSQINLNLGRAIAENQNRNQMNQLAIGLGSSLAGTLAGAKKEDLNKLFGGGNTTETTTFTPTGMLPSVNATNLYNNAMKTNYNVSGKMKPLNPLQQYATKNLSGNDYTQGVNFSGSVPFNLNKLNSFVSLPQNYDIQTGSQNMMQTPWNMQNKSLANAFNPNMYYKPRGRFDVQNPIEFQ